MAQNEGWSLAGNSQPAIRQLIDADALPRMSTMKRHTHTKMIYSRMSEFGVLPLSRQSSSRRSTLTHHRRSTHSHHIHNLHHHHDHHERKSSGNVSPVASSRKSRRSDYSHRKSQGNRASYSRPHQEYSPQHYTFNYHEHHHHHHHHHEPEPSQELLYLIPRQVIIQFGPYTFHGVCDFRVERLQGLQNVLEKMGAMVKLVPNTDYRNRVMAWYMDVVIFCCKVTDLIHGGDGELDPLCIHAAQAFDFACRKSIHGLRNRVTLASDRQPAKPETVQSDDYDTDDDDTDSAVENEEEEEAEKDPPPNPKHKKMGGESHHGEDGLTTSTHEDEDEGHLIGKSPKTPLSPHNNTP